MLKTAAYIEASNNSLQLNCVFVSFQHVLEYETMTAFHVCLKIPYFRKLNSYCSDLLKY